MRLNPDCTRDILIFLEERTSANGVLEYSARNMSEQLNDPLRYSAEEVMYHISQCALSGFFVGYEEDCSGNFILRDISPKAHEFLANVRSDTVWNKTKSVAGKIGTTSLNALCQIASTVISELIKSSPEL